MLSSDATYSAHWVKRKNIFKIALGGEYHRSSHELSLFKYYVYVKIVNDDVMKTHM